MAVPLPFGFSGLSEDRSYDHGTAVAQVTAPAWHTVGGKGDVLHCSWRQSRSLFGEEEYASTVFLFCFEYLISSDKDQSSATMSA